MQNKKVIVVNHYRRPRTSTMCLNHLGMCNGIKDYIVISYVEPENQDVINVVKDKRYVDMFGEHIVVVNDTLKGGTENERISLTHGFDLSDYVIFVEDDLLLYKDSLEFHEYCCQKFYEDKDVFNITLLNVSFGNLNPYIYMYGIGKRRQFSPAGFGIWRDRFDRINDMKLWDFDRKVSMDCHIGQNIHGNEIYPKISRIQNIGAMKGMYTRNKHWHLFNQFCIIWARSYETLLIDKQDWCFDWDNDILHGCTKDERDAGIMAMKALEKYARPS